MRKCYLRSWCFIFEDASPRCRLTHVAHCILWPSFTVLHWDSKGRVCLARNHQEGSRRTADPIWVRGEGGGVNGPRSRIPPLIKAPSVIIVLDRQMAFCRDLLPRRVFRVVVILFRCYLRWPRWLTEIKCPCCRSETTTFSSLIEEEHLRVKGRKVLRLHSLVKSKGRVFYELVHIL